MSLFEQVKAAGIEYASHESDLYIPCNSTTAKLIVEHGYTEIARSFRNNLDGQIWYDVPFAYTPYWEAKQRVNYVPDSAVKQ